MSLFNSIFGNSEEKKETVSKLNWIPLQAIQQLDEIVKASNDKPVLVFKHSTRCSISRMALKQFEQDFDWHDAITLYFLDLLAYREISNEIANRFGVVHQSPQILLIKNRKSVFDASHSDIDATVLKNYL